MSCETILEAMKGATGCEPTLDGTRYVTHCLYPSFEAVHVYVVRDGENYIVHDGRGAFRVACEHGHDDRGVARALEAEAKRFHLSVADNRLVVHDVPPSWLKSAILAVANASASAAIAVVSRSVAAADEELVSKIDRILSKNVAPNLIARDYRLKGASGGDRRFDFAIKGSEGYDLFINGVTSHHASYYSKFVAFADLDLDISKKISVRDERLATDVEALMLKVSTIVPLHAIGESRISAYSVRTFV